MPSLVTHAGGTEGYPDHFTIKTLGADRELFKKQDCGAIVFKPDGTVVGMVQSFEDADGNGNGDTAIVTKISEIVSALDLDSTLPKTMNQISSLIFSTPSLLDLLKAIWMTYGRHCFFISK